MKKQIRREKEKKKEKRDENEEEWLNYAAVIVRRSLARNLHVSPVRFVPLVEIRTSSTSEFLRRRRRSIRYATPNNARSCCLHLNAYPPAAISPLSTRTPAHLPSPALHSCPLSS